MWLCGPHRVVGRRGPPPLTAKGGLKENPKTRPSGTSHGADVVLQNGTKSAATGPVGDPANADIVGTVPAATAFQPGSNGLPGKDTPLSSNDPCTGGMLGFQCGTGNLFDPGTGTHYCNPGSANPAGNTCVPLALEGATSDTDTYYVRGCHESVLAGATPVLALNSGGAACKGPILDKDPHDYYDQLAMQGAKAGAGNVITRNLGDTPRLEAPRSG